MKKNNVLLKAVSILCAVVLTANTIGIGQWLVKANGSNFQTLGVEEITGMPEYKVPTGQESKSVAGTLEGMLLDGIYNFASGSSSINFGGGLWTGLMLNFNGEGMVLQYFNGANNTDWRGGVTFTPAETGYTTMYGAGAEDMRIKMGFAYANKTATTADVTITITVGNHTEELALGTVSLSKFNRSIDVYTGGTAVTIKAVPKTYQTLSVKEITGAPEKVVTGETPVFSAGDSSLDGVLIDGIYNFANPGSINFGGEFWSGLQLGFDANGMTFNYFNAINAGDHKGGLTFTSAETGYATMYGNGAEDMRIQIGFTYANENATAGTADVTIEITVGESTKSFVASGATMAKFKPAMAVYAVGNTITIKAVPTEEFTYENVGIEAITGMDEYLVSNGDGTKSVGTDDLDGVMLDGIYNFAGNSSINFGGVAWSGLHLGFNANGMVFYFFNTPGDSVLGSAEFTPAEIGCTNVFGHDLRIKQGFRFANVNEAAGTADVTIEITVGECTKSFVAIGAKTNLLKRGIYVYASGTSISIKAAKESDTVTYEQLDVSAFTGKHQETYANGQTGVTAGTGSLDGKQIDGIYHMTGAPIIDYGGVAWTGLQQQLEGNDLLFQFLNTTGANVLGSVRFTPEEAGYDAFTGEDIRIKIGFSFANENATAGTADVTIAVTVGECEKSFVASGANTNLFNRAMFIYASGSTLVLTSTLEAPQPDEEQAPAGTEPTYDKVMKFPDFGITSDTIIAGSEGRTSAGEGTLDGLMIDGTYVFSNGGIIDLGWMWGGLQFAKEGDALRYLFNDAGGKNVLHVRDITTDIAGCELFDTDLRIKGGFNILEENQNGTVDVLVEVRIGDTYRDLFILYGINPRNISKQIYMYAAEGSSVTLKVDDEDKQYIDEPDDKKISYKENLTFLDMAITKDYEVKQNQITKVIGEGTLNGVSIEGTYFLSGNSIFGFGGNWRGLQLQREGADILVYQYLDIDGKGGVYRKSVTSEDIGQQIYDKDLKIKVGFTFSNEEQSTGTADVTIEVCLGDTYRDVFTVKGVKTANLMRSVLLWHADGFDATDSAMILRKPKMTAEVKKDKAVDHKYTIELRDVFNIAITNKKAATSDTMYIEYKVKSSDSKIYQWGTILTDEPTASYPYLNGFMRHQSKAPTDPTLDDGELLVEGAEYIIIFEKKNDTITMLVQRTLNGETTVFIPESPFGAYNKNMKHMGIWFGGTVEGLRVNAVLENFKIYDANKNNLMPQFNSSAGIITTHYGELEDYTGCEALYASEDSKTLIALYANKTLKFTQNGVTKSGTYKVKDGIITMKIDGVESKYEYQYQFIKKEDGTAYNRVHTCVVSFDTAGGTAIDNQILNEVNGYQVLRPTDPTLEGSKFMGWYTEDGTEFDFEQVITKSITLYAKWSGAKYDKLSTESVNVQQSNNLYLYIIGGTVILVICGGVGAGIIVKEKRRTKKQK